MKTWIRVPITAVVLLPAVLLFQVKPIAPIKTTVCELVRHPDRLSGKIVQVRGNVVSGMETGGLIDPSCSAFVLVSSFDPLFSRLGGEFAFIKSFDDLKQPTALIWRPAVTFRPIDDDDAYRPLVPYLKKFRQRDGSACFHCPLCEVTVTMTGRFDHLETHVIAVRAGPTAKIETYYAGFGHLNAALSRLVLRSVSDVTAVPIDPAVYDKKE